MIQFLATTVLVLLTLPTIVTLFLGALRCRFAKIEGRLTQLKASYSESGAIEAVAVQYSYTWQGKEYRGSRFPSVSLAISKLRS